MTAREKLARRWAEQVNPRYPADALDWWDRGVFDHGAAAEALRIVAGLRVEYAVQVPVATAADTVWRYVVRRGNRGGLILTNDPGMGKWETSKQDAEKRAELHQLTDYQIVTRLTTTPEVAE